MFDVERWTFVWSGRVGWFEGVERAGAAAAGLRHSRGPEVGFSVSITSSRLRLLTSDFLLLTAGGGLSEVKGFAVRGWQREVCGGRVRMLK